MDRLFIVTGRSFRERERHCNYGDNHDRKWCSCYTPREFDEQIKTYSLIEKHGPTLEGDLILHLIKKKETFHGIPITRMDLDKLSNIIKNGMKNFFEECAGEIFKYFPEEVPADFFENLLKANTNKYEWSLVSTQSFPGNFEVHFLTMF